MNANHEKALRHSGTHGGLPISCMECLWVGVVKTIAGGQIELVGGRRCPMCQARTRILTRADPGSLRGPDD